MRTKYARSVTKTAGALAAGVALVLACSLAVAQPPAGAPAGKGAPGGPGAPGGHGGRGGGMPFEKHEAEWALQANTVAQELGLNADLTAKLAEAYKAARTAEIDAIQAKLDEAQGQGQGQRPDFQAIRQAMEAEKAKFDTAIKGFLSAEQAAKAIVPLGAFSRRWDFMVATLKGFALDDKVMAQAMKLVEASVVESEALRAGLTPGERPSEEWRAKMQAQKEKLDAEMAKLLSADQMTKWKEATEMRRGAGGRRGAGMAGAPGAPGAPAGANAQTPPPPPAK